MIGKSPPFKGLNTRIPVIIPITGSPYYGEGVLLIRGPHCSTYGYTGIGGLAIEEVEHNDSLAFERRWAGLSVLVVPNPDYSYCCYYMLPLLVILLLPRIIINISDLQNCCCSSSLLLLFFIMLLQPYPSLPLLLPFALVLHYPVSIHVLPWCYTSEVMFACLGYTVTATGGVA